MPWSRRSFFFFSLALAACNGVEDTTDTTDTSDTSDTTIEPVPFTGDWAEISGAFPDRDVWGYHAINQTTWVDAFGSTYTIAQFGEDYVIAQNGDGNPYNPSLWSRFDVVTTDEGLAYCQTAYDAASEQAALDTPPANASDLDGGCGTFPWSRLVPKLPVTGLWNDGFVDHVVDEASWTLGTDQFHVYAASTDHLVAQNDADNAWSAGLWSRFDWHLDGADLYYCQIAYDAASADAAEGTTPADTADLDTGCAGFPWSLLTPVAE